MVRAIRPGTMTLAAGPRPMRTSDCELALDNLKHSMRWQHLFARPEKRLRSWHWKLRFSATILVSLEYKRLCQGLARQSVPL